MIGVTSAVSRESTRATVLVGRSAVTCRVLRRGRQIIPERGVPGSILLHIVRSGALTLGMAGEAQHPLPSLDGTAVVTDFSSVSRVSAGGLFITDGVTPHQGVVAGECELVSLSVPADMFPVDVRVVLTGPMVVAPPSTLNAAVGEFLAGAVESDDGEMSGAQRYFFERMLSEMAMSLIAGSVDAWDAPRQEKTFPAALAVIAARCADPALTAAVVATDVNVSVRQLARVFSAHSTTVGNEIRRARVDRAVRMLGSADFDGMSVDQVAKRSGFARGSSLARAMDAVGEGTPGEVRAARR